MPIFEYNGNKVNVNDDQVSEFAKYHPDAITRIERDGKVYGVRPGDMDAFNARFTNNQEGEQASQIYYQPQATTENTENKDTGSFIGDIGERFLSGAASATGSAFNLLDKGASAINRWTGSEGGFFKEASNYMKGLAEYTRKKSDRYQGKGFTDLVKEGDYSGALGSAVLDATESAPLSLGIMATGGTGLVGAGVLSASDKYDQLKQENPEMPAFNRYANSILTGAAESLSEVFGAGTLGKVVKSTLKAGGKKAAADLVKKNFLDKLASFESKHWITMPILAEGSEEAANALAEYVVDNATGVKRDDNIFETMINAAVPGAMGGAQFVPMVGAGKAYGWNKKRKVTNAYGDASKGIEGIFNEQEKAQFDETIHRFQQNGNINDINMFLFNVYAAKGLSEDQRKAVLDYTNASMSYNNYVSYVNDRINDEVKRRMEDIDSNINEDMGTVMQAVVNGDTENPVFVTKGKLYSGDMDDNMNPTIDYDKSDDVIYYRDKDGKIQQCDVKNVSYIENEKTRANLYAEIMDEVRGQVISEEENDINFAPGDEVVLPDGNTGTIQSKMEDGSYTVVSNGMTNQFTADQLGKPDEQAEPVPEITADERAATRMDYPTKDGKIDFDNINDPQMFHDGLLVEFKDDAESSVDEFIANLDKELKNAGNMKDPIKKRRKIAEINQKLDFFNQVKSQFQPKENTTATVESAEAPVEQAMGGITEQPVGTNDVQPEQSVAKTENSSSEEPVSATPYEDRPVDDTIYDLLDGQMDIDEVNQFVEANKKASDKALKEIEGKKPQVGTDRAEYLRQKSAWQALMDDARRKSDYWTEVKNGLDKGSITEAEQNTLNAYDKQVPLNAHELAARALANGSIKLLREDYQRETGGGNAEANKMFGIFASEQKGGVGIERAGEILTQMDHEAGTNFLDPDDPNAARDVIIDVLSQVRTRGDLINYIRDQRQAQQRREEEAAYNDFAKYTTDAYGMTPEEYQAYEDDFMRNVSSFDAEVSSEVDGMIYDGIKQEIDDYNEVEQQLNNNDYGENEQGGVSEEGYGGGEILYGQSSVPVETGDRAVEGAGQAVAYGDVQDETPQGEAGGAQEERITQQPDENTGVKYSQRIAESEQEVDVNATDAQKEAGNYKKGHLKLKGFDITIENPAGSVRSGVDKNGSRWENRMNNTYGYFKGTQGVDGDHIDVYLSNDMDNWSGDNVYVIDQYNPDGSFDEHKVMFGFDNKDEALSNFLANYSQGWGDSRKLDVTPISMDGFKKWVDSSHRKTKPFASYKAVKALTEEVDQKRTNIREDGTLIDESGNPLILYHGTPDASLSIDRLEAGHARLGEDEPARFNGDGISFTPNESVALDYSDGGKGKVLKANIVLRNPWYTVGNANMSNDEARSFTDRLKREGYDGIINYSSQPMREIGALPAEVIVFDRSSLRPVEDVAKEATVESSEPITGTERSPYAITPYKYTTQKGKVLDMRLVSFDAPLTDEQKKIANKIAKEDKGWFDRKSSGYLMRSEDSARRLADAVIKSNESVGSAGQTAKQNKSDYWEGVTDELMISEEENGIIRAFPKHDSLRIELIKNTQNGTQEIRVHTKDNQAETPAKINAILEKEGYSVNTDGSSSGFVSFDNYEDAKRFAAHVDEVERQVHTQKSSSDNTYGSKNKIVSNDRYEELKKRMRDKLNQLNVGIDPEMLQIGIEMAVYHIEAGAVKFTDFSKAMIADLGDKIRPYLKSFYNGARDLPEAVDAGLDQSMTPYDEVKRFDIVNFEKTGNTAMDIIEGVAKEQNVEQEAERIKNTADDQSVKLSIDDIEPGMRVILKDGRNVLVSVVMHSGEQVGALQFSKPRVDRLYSTYRGEMLDISPKDVDMDATRRLMEKNEVTTPVKEKTKQEKPNKSKKKAVASRESNERSLFDNESTNDKEEVENGLRPIHELRPEGLPTDGVQSEQGLRGIESETGQGAGQESRGSDIEREGYSPDANRDRSEARLLNQRNNRSERGVDYAPKSVDARIEANIKAIELANELYDSGQQATPDQMAVLRRFSGWGGLGKAFQKDNPTSSKLRELLGDEAYEQANLSRNSAYYTPSYIIDSLWDIARNLGFKGGRVLEGSAGIGNIIGAMPKDMSDRSDIQAVEIDQTTGKILSLLYPDANVEIKGFESTKVENGSVDLAITNVPFVTGQHVIDDTGDKDLSRKFRNIHDFCIAKNVRKLREGGIGIFISSNGTLDNSQKLRNWVVNEGKSDFIGAFRLNKKTFGGTGVTSDIIIIRKRVNGARSSNAIDVSQSDVERVEEYDTGETRKVKGKEERIIKSLPLDYNKYFMEHPENMAGVMRFGFEEKDTYHPTSKGLFPSKDKDQEQMLEDWVKSFAGMRETMEERQTENQSSNTYDKLGKDVKEGSMLLNSAGKLCVASFGNAVPLDLNDNKIKGHTKKECFLAYRDVKRALSELMDYEANNEGDEGLNPLLDKLNRAFDRFVKTYGHLHKNTAISFLKNDIDFQGVLALEKYEEKSDENGKRYSSFEKTDVFRKRVIDHYKDPIFSNVKDGIVASIYKNGRIDVPYIASTLGRSEDEVSKEIINSGLGFEDPVSREIEVVYEYLSGNVREKLAKAKEENKDGRYDSNIKALEAKVPMNIPSHLIEFSIGSSWIDSKLYDDFVKEMTGVSVRSINAGGTWELRKQSPVETEKNRAMGVISAICHKTVLGHELIEAAMQNKTITVSETIKISYDGTTETITDKEATQACSNKIDEIRQQFKDWARERMQTDPDMSNKIESIYNEKFNNYVPKSIPEEFIPDYFPGASKVFKMRPHQAKAIIRGTTQPLLLAHEVGTGKTFTMISIAMEMRRLGTAKKPMIVVQNATTGQFVESAKALYPNAKVLSLSDKDHTLSGRQSFYAKIKYNDWDMIVIPQSVFERIPDSEERRMAFVKDKIDEKMAILEQMKKEDENSFIVKAAEREIEQLSDELSSIGAEIENKKKDRDAKKDALIKQNASVMAMEMLDREVDDVENFDDMGIDAILVDEAHEYKHLGFATAMKRGVKGVDPSYSKKAQGVYLKAQSVLERNNGKNVIFATGTPISNTAAEIWTFMRYLMPADVMKEYDIYYFDDFVRNFGNLQQMLEFTTSGNFRENNRFAGYVNLPELVRMWSSVADTVRTEEAEGVKEKIPAMETGKAQDIYLPQTKALRSIMKYVKEELREYDNMSGKEKKANSHIPLTMYGIAKAAAVDVRLVSEDAADDPNSKTNESVRQTLRSLKDSDKYKGTVALFADNYQNKKTGFNLYEDIKKKLVKAGVPADKIVIMRSDMTAKKKLEIFDKVNSGDIRVIMGSTFTLGTGVNIQERLHTLIHIDAPNRPMDYTQRNGRILRQGNIHKDMGIPVRVLRFGVEDSLDVTAYQRLKTKGAIAESIMRGKEMMKNSMENRSLEEDEDVFGDTVAQLSGSEYAMLKSQAEKEVRKLNAKKKQWEADQIYIHNAIPSMEGRIKEAEDRVRLNEDRLSKIKGNDGKIKVNGIIYDSVDGMAEFFKTHNKKQKEDETKIRERGTNEVIKRNLSMNIGGFDFEFTTTLSGEFRRDKGDLRFTVGRKATYSCPELDIENRYIEGGYIRNGVESIINDVISGEDFREWMETAKASSERMKEELGLLKSRKGKPFQFEKDLNDAIARLEDYTDRMKQELQDKEAKYQKMDSEVEAATGLSEADEDDVLYREGDNLDDIESVNERFNERLDELVDNPNQKDRILHLGNSSKFLQEGGISDAEIILEYDKLVRKSVESYKNRHPYSIEDIKDLPKAISSPIAVFVNTNENNDHVILTELKKDGKYFIVAIKTSRQNRKGGVILTVNEIVTLFPKDEKGIINWINTGKATNIDKEKALRFIEALPNHPGTTITNEELYSATKVVKDFVNPILYDGNIEEESALLRPVTDEETLDRLNNEETIKVYRAMQVIDGKLYPPMSAKVGGKLREPINIDEWEEAEERPELATEDGKFVLNKGNGSSLKAAYNPYIHTSRSPLNDQFSSAQDRDNLVVVEVEIPKSELTSGYKAYKAKDPVGEMTWHSGPVSSKLKGEKARKVILTRWDKPVRIVPDSEVARRIAKLLEGEDIIMPSNVVTPSLRAELEKLGVPFIETDNRGKPILNREGEGSVYDTTYRQRMRDEAENMGRALGVEVEIEEDGSTLPGKKGKAKGFFDRATKKVTVVVGNHKSIGDIQATVLHEVVGHYGLRGLLGERFDNMMDMVYRTIDKATRKRIAEAAVRNYRGDVRIATEEYLASVAERGVDRPGVWSRIKSAIKAFFRSMGIDLRMSDEDIAYLLWKSKNRLMDGDSVPAIIDKVAKDQEMREGLLYRDGLGFGSLLHTPKKDRKGLSDIAHDVMGKIRNGNPFTHENFVRLQEGYQDRLIRLKEFQDKVAKETGHDVKDFEDMYTFENQAHSRAQQDIEDFLKDAMESVWKIHDEIARTINKPAGENIREIETYLMARHGLERNAEMRKREIDALRKSGANPSKDDIDKINAKDFSGLTAISEEITGSPGMDEKACEQFAKDFESKHDTGKLWKAINKATNATLDKLLETGQITKELYSQIKGMYKYYIPLKEWDGVRATDMYDYVEPDQDIVSNPLKQAKGRKTRAGNVLANIASDYESATMLGYKNLCKLRLLNLARNSGTSELSVSEQWYTKGYDANGNEIWEPASATGFTEDAAHNAQVIQDFNDNMRALQKSGDALLHKDVLRLGVPVKKWQEKQHTVRVKEAGREILIYFNGDPRVAQAINGQNNVKLDNAILRVANRLRKWMMLNYTARNINFILRNFARDFFYVNTMNFVKYGAAFEAKYIANFPKAFSEICAVEFKGRKVPEYESFRKNGGMTGYVEVMGYDRYKNEIERIVKKSEGRNLKVGDFFHAIGSYIERFNSVIENCSRYTVYKTAKQTGMSELKAIEAAKEASVNFNRRGSGQMGAVWAQNAYFFFNASMQGTENFVSAANKNKARAAMALGFWVALGYTMRMIGAALSGDDDDSYDNLPDYVRQNNIVLYVPGTGNKYIMLPLPVELRAIFGLGDMLGQASLGQYKGRDFAGDLALKLTDLLPKSVEFPDRKRNDDESVVESVAKNLSPDAIRPLLDAYWFNENYFGKRVTGRNAYNKHVPEWQKVSYGTSKTIINASRMMNELTGGDYATKGWSDSMLTNPSALEYLFEQYLGGVGKVLTQSYKSVEGVVNGDLAMRNIPVLSGLTYSTENMIPRNYTNERYRSYIDEYEETASRMRKYKEGMMEGEDLSDEFNGFTNSDAFRRYMLIGMFKKQIDGLYDMVKTVGSDSEEAKNLNRYARELKGQMINEIDKLDENEK
ncbi:hypothetical protein JQM84_06735 [Parabacteroides distasonis]|nr:hypothetical protein [Parabacteroides distasonis]